jgi:tetratricopeptide (TPR) repeat protein
MYEAGFRTGDFTGAHELLEAARARAVEEGDRNAEAAVVSCLGMLVHYENITKLMAGGSVPAADADAEEELFRAALAVHEEFGDRASAARALFGLGLVHQVLHHDWATAMTFYRRVLDLDPVLAEDGDLYGRSEIHRHIGFYYQYEDIRPEDAVRHLDLSLRLREELGDPRRLPSGQVALADAELAAGNPRRAVELSRAAVDGARANKLLAGRIEDAESTLRDAEAALAAAN